VVSSCLTGRTSCVGGMEKILLLPVLFFVIFSFSPRAFALGRTIKLKDGSAIHGEVLSKEGNVYKIKTEALGTIFVPEEGIVSIGESEAVVASGEEKAYQQKILGNPQTMESVKALAQDQVVVAILSDPKLRDAVARHDFQYLQTNEKFIKFMNNPTVQKIINDTTTPEQKEKAGQ